MRVGGSPSAPAPPRSISLHLRCCPSKLAIHIAFCPVSYCDCEVELVAGVNAGILSCCPTASRQDRDKI